MQVPTDALRNLYRVVALKGTCYVSELPVLYKTQCGSDLNYKEMGFQQLPLLTEKCDPYIKQKYDVETGQWCLTIGRRLPNSIFHSQSTADASLDSHNIELATRFLYSGKFKSTNLKIPLDCLTCSLCYSFVRTFYLWKKCHHSVCESCTKTRTVDDLCRLCHGRDFEEDEIMKSPEIRLPNEILKNIAQLQCRCPFDHAKTQFMTISQFFTHFSQCPLNSEFTNAKVVEQAPGDDSDDEDDEISDDQENPLRELTDEITELVNNYVELQIIAESVQLPSDRNKRRAAATKKRTVAPPPGLHPTEPAAPAAPAEATPAAAAAAAAASPPGNGRPLATRHERRQAAVAPSNGRRPVVAEKQPPPSSSSSKSCSRSGGTQSSIDRSSEDEGEGGLCLPPAKYVDDDDDEVPPSKDRNGLTRMVAAGDRLDAASIPPGHVMGRLFVYRAYNEYTISGDKFPAYGLPVKPGEKVHIVAMTKGSAGWLYCRKKSNSTEGWVPTQAFRKPYEKQNDFTARLYHQLGIQQILE